MSDKTFGVKVSEELYEKVKMMIDNSGSTSKDWFEKAVALTEVQDLKTGSPDYKQDLSELEIHTTRIYELVANMILRANYIKDDAIHELNEKLNSRETTIASLQNNVKELQEHLTVAEEATKRSVSEQEGLSEQLEGLRSTNSNNQDLIQEYKNKIDTLSSLVTEYRGYATENTELKETFAAEKSTMTSEFEQKENRLVTSIEELKATVHGQQDEISRLNEKLDSTVKENERETEALKANYINQLTQLTNEKNLEKERAVLEVERDYQAKLQTIHDQYNDKIAHLYEKFERNEGSKKKKQTDEK
jgi:chromosome segregation ATPase